VLKPAVWATPTLTRSTRCGVSADSEENLYPTHFTYNFVNSGKGSYGSWYYWGWDLIKEMGVPNQKVYGGLAPGYDATSWMSGFAKYESAMQNRLTGYRSLKVDTPEGLDTLKRWFYDHGNGAEVGGVALFAAGATGYSMTTLAESTPQAGKRVITVWGKTMNHAMTFVGYDDEVRWDYNGDGRYTNDEDINGDGVVNMRDWEIGALIVVNSWGKSWGDGGKSYMMYKLLAEKQNYTGDGGVYRNEVYVIDIDKKDASYTPTHGLRLKMTHSHRNDLRLEISVRQSDVEGELVTLGTQSFGAFGYRSGDLPLRGKGNSDPIEMSFDISRLMKRVDTSRSLEIVVRLEDQDRGSQNQGEVLALSLMELESGKETILAGMPKAIAVNSKTELVLQRKAAGEKQSTYAQLNLRGSFNSWKNAPMTLVADYTWQLENVVFGKGGEERFKFDVYGDWKLNYGDNDGDGSADKYGADIQVEDGATYTITFNDLEHSYTIKKTSDGGGGKFKSTFTSLHYRGTSNRWQADAMKLVGDYTWQIEVTTASSNTERFKLDVAGDWSKNYGDNGADGKAERNGADIALEADTRYTITFNDQTLQYAAVKRQQQTFKKAFAQVYYRGSSNGWQTSEMQLVADYTWELTITSGSSQNERFKLDIKGDWSKNYGDNDGDGIVDRNGADIPLEASTQYVITFNDQTKRISVAKK
jgi:hypothetical protein